MIDIETLLKAKKLIDSGLSKTKVAEKLNLDRHTLSKELKLKCIDMNTSSNISDSEIDEMEKLLSEGKSFKQIGEILGVDRKRVSVEMKSRGLTSKKSQNRGMTKEDVEKEYKTFIKSGLTLTEYCEQTSKRRSTLSDNFKKYNLDIPKNSGAKPLNKFYFDTLSEDSAYWLGLLLADGSVNKYYDNLELSLKDKEHIEKFKLCLESGHDIQTKEIKNIDSIVYRINIHDHYIINRLKELGIENNKTYKTLIISDEITESLMRHFVRGFFDGDGHYILNKEKTVVRYMGITQYDIESLQLFQDILRNYLGINSYIREQDEHAPSLNVYRANDIKTLSDWLYKDCNIYLDRKYQIYKTLIAVDEE